MSQSTSVSSFQCLKSNSYHFAIVRVYKSSGAVDTNGPKTINNAWAGGMSNVDGYIFPCYSCGNPAGQMDATISALAAGGVTFLASNETTKVDATKPLGSTYGMLWIDVEGTQYWSTSHTNNVNFIAGMINRGVQRGISIGVYTSNSQWTPITGGSTQFSKYPLWYAHYDSR